MLEIHLNQYYYYSMMMLLFGHRLSLYFQFQEHEHEFYCILCEVNDEVR